MDMNHLYYFKKVAEQQNITRAAELLSITQPALSRVIHNLEAELGHRLFDRCGKNIVLNKKGEAFLRYTNQTLDALEMVKSELRDIEKQKISHIRIAMRTSLWILPVLIRHFKEMKPDITLDVIRNVAGEQDADIIIDAALEKPDGEAYSLLVEEKFCLLLSGQLLAEYPEDASLRNFSGETFFALQGGVEKEITQSACQSAGFMPSLSTDFLSSVTIHSFLETGLGVAIVPEKLWNFAAYPGLVMADIPITDKKKYTYIKCNNRKNENIMAFCEFCIAFFRQLEEEECRNYFSSELLKGNPIYE